MASLRSGTTAFLFHTAFILLSGAAGEPRRCYWCGPLAEQVHRSRRSAACGAAPHETVCEPGYDYCAVVATSPPRVESRYCVKIYQDECYPLYCNSTKTWKMTCPCRGDLCNGPNTERENEAFALLPKLVAKTHNTRIKKRTASAAPHLIRPDAKKRIIANDDAEIHNMSYPSSNMDNFTNDNKVIVTENYVTMSNIGDNLKPENMQADQPTNQPLVVEQHNEETGAQSTVVNIDKDPTSTTVNNQLIEIVIHVSDPTEKPDTMNEIEKPCTDSTPESNDINKDTIPVKEGENMSTIVQSISNTDAPIQTTGNLNNIESVTMKTTENVRQPILEIKPTNKFLAEASTATTEVMPKDQSMNPMDQMQNDAPLVNPTDTVQSLKTTEVIKIDEPPTKDTAKANDGMPTAEALQQNGNPPVSLAPVPVTEKPPEPTTTESATTPTVSTTPEQVTKMITTPTTRRKNNAVQLTFTYTLLLMGVVYL